MTRSLNRRLRVRLAGFSLAMGLLLLLVYFGARSAWDKFHALHDRLLLVNVEGFQVADFFERSLMVMNNSLFRVAVRKRPEDWQDFVKQSTELDRWLERESVQMESPSEKRILDEIYLTFASYRKRAESIHAIAMGLVSEDALIESFAEFERRADELLHLRYRLARTHRASLDEFLEDVNASVRFLRWLLIGALVMLGALGFGLSTVVYRDLIAPLRLQLLESHTLLQRQEKLASLGLLAAGVAHEIRNPLTALKARLYMLKRRLRPDAPEHLDADVIDSELDRLARIVRQFLQFARPADPVLAPVRLADCIQEVSTLLGPAIRERGTDLQLGLDPSVHVAADAEQLKQVLINLIQNAAEATPPGGLIRVRTSREGSQAGDKTQPLALIEIEDTGKGISASLQDRLFDPFFSTKEGGTGLGLSIAARIVEKHGGAIRFQSRENIGTVFGVLWPMAAPAPVPSR
jgi:signal transduction histidine kinase